MIEQTIKSETVQVGNAFKTFLKSQSETIAGFVNTIVMEDGTPSDASIEVTDDAVTIYQFAPDKGFVLSEQPEGSALPVQLALYKEVPEGNKYLYNQKEFISLCVKTKTGEPDAVLGRFKNQNDAIKNFNHEDVSKAFKNWTDKKEADEKRAEKTQKKLEKLASQGVELPKEGEPAMRVSSNNG